MLLPSTRRSPERLLLHGCVAAVAELSLLATMAAQNGVAHEHAEALERQLEGALNVTGERRVTEPTGSKAVTVVLPSYGGM